MLSREYLAFSGGLDHSDRFRIGAGGHAMIRRGPRGRVELNGGRVRRRKIGRGRVGRWGTHTIRRLSVSDTRCGPGR